MDGQKALQQAREQQADLVALTVCAIGMQMGLAAANDLMMAIARVTHLTQEITTQKDAGHVG